MPTTPKEKEKKKNHICWFSFKQQDLHQGQ
jgi:hypothetical protein